MVLGDIAVEDIVEGAFGDEGAVDHDDATGEQSGVVVGRLPARPTDQRDSNADCGGCRSDRVGKMMPGVSLERAAVDIPAELVDFAGENPFHCDDDQEDGQREPLGGMVRGANFQDRVPRDHPGGGQHGGPGEKAGKGFDATVTIGVVLIRRTERKLEADPGNQRSENVGGRFNAIGNERIGIANQPDGNLHRHQDDVDAQGEQTEGGGFADLDHGAVRFFGSRMPSPRSPAASRPRPRIRT